MRDKVILHSDMNSFYASVETMLHPELSGKPVAVCGSAKNRHGIILAKSDAARKAGVKTGMSNYEAVGICPGLILRSPDYRQYLKFSAAAKEIYGRYTDYIEPFGMDEAWLDVSGSAIFGDGPEIAGRIRESIHRELGLTVSIGVSWNKIFAKLGSDMKKPDAVTVITRENYRTKVWPLNVSELLYCGPSSSAKLRKIGIHSIGQLASADPDVLKKLLGINGIMLKRFAQGSDESRVCLKDTVIPPESLGHGVTCTSDLTENIQVRRVILELAQDLGHRLRSEKCLAAGVTLYIRTNDLSRFSVQGRFRQPTGSPQDITDEAYRLFIRHRPACPVRQITVEVHDLIGKNAFIQTSLFVDQDYIVRREKFEEAVDQLRGRFGNGSVFPASLLLEDKIPHDGRELVKIPDRMYT